MDFILVVFAPLVVSSGKRKRQKGFIFWLFSLAVGLGAAILTGMKSIFLKMKKSSFFCVVAFCDLLAEGER